jgi:16S rRNA (uracil1498-N3)-methyltransferase
MRADHRAIRLYVDVALQGGTAPVLSPEQSHYLDRVMRVKTGDRIIAFNNRDGEWACSVAEISRKAVTLRIDEALRPPAPQGHISYFFAPLKQARLDYMVQKAVEMGVARLGAVMTQHTMVSRLNLERMQANAIEAAEQCTMIAVPEIVPEQKLQAMLAARAPDDVLVFCDEAAPIASPLKALAAIPLAVPISVLIGPEGGFSDQERALLLDQPRVIVLSLGPRIMRADTAAVAALAFVQAVCGDIT